MIFAAIWFICALASFWMWARITYNDGDVITKRDFIGMLALCIFLAPFMLVGMLIGILIQYLDEHGKDEVHFMDRFFEKGDNDD